MITAHLFVPQIFVHWLSELLDALFELLVELFELLGELFDHLGHDSKEDQVAHDEAAYNQRRIAMFAEIETGVSDVVEECHRQEDGEGDIHVNWFRHGPELDRGGEQ